MNLGYESGNLTLSDHYCPFKPYCVCFCAEFITELCEGECAIERISQSVGAVNRAGCNTCYCTCSLFKREECELICTEDGLVPIRGTLDVDNCKICNCTCPLHSKEDCLIGCFPEGKVPVVGSTNFANCSVCQCQCKEINCKVDCKGNPYTFMNTSFGCMECLCGTRKVKDPKGKTKKHRYRIGNRVTFIDMHSIP